MANNNLISRFEIDPRLIAADVKANQMLGGREETISARVGRMRDTNRGAGILAAGLDKLDPGHSARSVAKWDAIHAAKAEAAATSSTFTFTSPEGKDYTIEGPAGATQEEAFGMLQQHIAANPPSTAEQTGSGLKRAAGLTARTLATAATGLAGTVADPIMGLANIGRNALAKGQGQPMPEQMQMPSAALQNLMTQAGLPNAVSGAEKAAMLLGSLAGGKIDPLARGLTAKFIGANPLYNASTTGDRVLSTRQAMEAGYKLPPSSTAGGAGLIAKGAEAIGGTAQLNQILTTKNQALTDTLMRRAAGLAPDTPLNNATLEGAIASTFKSTYEPIRALPQITNGGVYRQKLVQVLKEFGDAAPGAKNEAVHDLVNAYRQRSLTGAQAVSFIKTLRTNADKAMRSSDAGSNELGLANRGIANAIEDSIQLNLSRNPAYANFGQDLMGQFKAGRTLMAKQHAVQESLLEGTGSGSAAKLAAQLNKGVPLTDELRTIAKTANIAPNVMKLPKADATLLTPFESTMGTMGMGGALMGSPMGLMGVGIPAVKLGARQALATGPVQNMMKPPLDPSILGSTKKRMGILQSLPALMQQYGLFANPPK